MDGRRLRRLPDDVCTRTELLLLAIALIVVETTADVDRDGRKHLPLVLQIDALRGLGLCAVVRDGDRLASLDEIAGVVEAAREHRRRCAADAAIMLEERTEAECVGVGQPIGAVDLRPFGDVLLEGVLRLSVEQQFAQRVGRILKRRVAREQRPLDAERPAVVKVGDLAEAGSFGLSLVQVVGQEIGLAVHIPTRVGVSSMQAVRIGDLELLVGETADEGGHDSRRR